MKTVSESGNEIMKKLVNQTSAATLGVHVMSVAGLGSGKDFRRERRNTECPGVGGHAPGKCEKNKISEHHSVGK